MHCHGDEKTALHRALGCGILKTQAIRGKDIAGMADDFWDEVIEEEEFFEDMEMLEEQEREEQARGEQILSAPARYGQAGSVHAQRAQSAQTGGAAAGMSQSAQPAQPASAQTVKTEQAKPRRGKGCLTALLIALGVIAGTLLLDAVISLIVNR